ncbi:MAG: GNAT family N-acetyltransferase [Planctomycetes bacterium RBG_13_46_10]|nr:MAG: GNAT family N-acetyltransferase [Planctomycetes bacterium RBG_13_46_10]
MLLQIFAVEKNEELEIIKDLFVEYADSLGFDLSFQDFAQELANLDEHYAPPDNCLLLAQVEGQAIGCVAMKQFSQSICEMKRLYVKPKFRGLGIGKALAEAIIEQARKISYIRMRLDTVPSMEAARSLYATLGFQEIYPYTYNPIEGAVFMELKLS